MCLQSVAERFLSRLHMQTYPVVASASVYGWQERRSGGLFGMNVTTESVTQTLGVRIWTTANENVRFKWEEETGQSSYSFSNFVQLGTQTEARARVCVCVLKCDFSIKVPWGILAQCLARGKLAQITTHSLSLAVILPFRYIDCSK